MLWVGHVGYMGREEITQNLNLKGQMYQETWHAWKDIKVDLEKTGLNAQSELS